MILIDIFYALEDWERRKRIIQTEEDFKDAVRQLAASPLIAVDVETTPLPEYNKMRSVELLGIGLANEAGFSCYIPLNHTTQGPQLCQDKVIAILNKFIFGNEEIIKLAHNMKFDMGILTLAGAEFKGKMYDTLVMAWLLDQDRSNKQKDLATSVLGIKQTRFKDVNGGKLKDARLSDVSLYCRMDCKVCILLYHIFKEQLEEENLMSALELEMRVLPVTLAMELEGMIIDVDALSIVLPKVSKEVARLQAEAFEIIGRVVNLDSPLQVGRILYEELGLPVIRRTKKGAPSTNNITLEELSGEHPFVDVLLQYRLFHKLETTYTGGFQKILTKENKIYGEFNQIGTDTGRYSSSNPNLQNIPRDSQDEDGIKFRKIFCAPDGYDMIVADYSQVEVRLLAHYSHDENLMESFLRSGIDVHRMTAALMFGVEYDKVTKEQRQIAKNINFGLSYGAGPKKLAQMVGCSVEEAKNLLGLHHARYSGIPKWKNYIVERCRENTFVRTLIGRKRRLPEINSDDGNLKSHAERQAVNTVIQGSAADIVKAAMIKLYEDERLNQMGIKLVSQVHDEIISLCPEKYTQEAMERIKYISEHPLKRELDVPLIMDIGFGKNWSDAK